MSCGVGRVCVLVGSVVAGLALANCGDGPPTELECEAWAREAFTGRRDAQNQADRACSQDADCVIVDYTLDCLVDCGYPSAIARAAVPRLESAIVALDPRACSTFQARGCAVPPALPCVPAASTTVAECREGECTLP